jgi:hypothetical protein
MCFLAKNALFWPFFYENIAILGHLDRFQECIFFISKGFFRTRHPRPARRKGLSERVLPVSDGAQGGYCIRLVAGANPGLSLIAGGVRTETRPASPPRRRVQPGPPCAAAAGCVTDSWIQLRAPGRRPRRRRFLDPLGPIFFAQNRENKLLISSSLGRLAICMRKRP